MASFRKRGRVWHYRYIDADGVQHERKGCSDLRATEAMAAHAEAEAGRVRSGMLDPRSESRRQHAARSLASHLDDWHNHLLDKGATAKHADLHADRARRVAALAAGGNLAEIDAPRTATDAERKPFVAALGKRLASARLVDLTGDRVQRALADLRDGGRSLATCNHHRAAIRGFSRWARRAGRTTEDTVDGVSGFNAREDRRHDRRTIGVDDLRRLIAVAHAGPSYQGMTGPSRALCYRLAVVTGLRFSEIKSIRPESFDFGKEPAVVTVRASYTKNGAPATLPLPDDVADDLVPFLATISTGQPVFALPAKGADMLKVDLASAGIPYIDAAGLVFDFHALRCECATLADQAGSSPRVVQALMRHSTLELTGKYTRPRANDLEAATAGLPSLRPAPPEAEPVRMTGTDASAIHMKNLRALPLPYGGDGMGHVGADAGGLDEKTPDDGGCRNTLGSPVLDGSRRPLTGTVASSGGGTRTPDTRIMIPLL
jgi:integrase